VSDEDPRAPGAEQAALRRIATLVAQGVAPEEVFAAVTKEVGRLIGVEYAGLNRYEPDGTTMTIVSVWSRAGGQVPPGGTRQILGGKNISTIVFQTGRAARIDGYADSSGPLGLSAVEYGIGSGVGTPLVVEGRLWGVMSVFSRPGQPLPADTGARLASFTELVVIAIANAESRAGLARLAEEQAALRGVATLVARGIPEEELFAAVTEEIGPLLGAEYAFMGRYEPDGTLVVVGAWGAASDHAPVGSRRTLGGRNLVTIVFETARSARIDDYAGATGPLGVAARDTGVRSAVGTPITVEGRLWGVMIVGSRLEERMPADTEERLSQFTELLATAVANAESRAELARLAEQQAALRRVATLVARGTPPEEVFAAVIDEVGRLFPVDYAGMARYEPDGTVTAVAARGTTHFPVGSSLILGGKNTATLVFETGRPVRIDGYADASGPMGASARERGVRSSVAAPIIVEGRLWGTIGAGSTGEQPLPPDTEARLADFTELVATAIANADSHAALAASRARIVAAADQSRRRIERDLHDGAQQRLVHAVIVLKLALQALSNGNANAGELVAEALRHAEQASSELRELAHGILPAALTRGGLRAGVNGLVSRVSLPVSVEVSVERLPAGVEATAYFVVSEALTNVVKHARASCAEVSVRLDSGELRVEICDDGVGGARGDDGTGLGGLADRVSALDGRLVLESPPGGGTRLYARLPVASQD
jgi:GAF domain-containing protein